MSDLPIYVVIPALDEEDSLPLVLSDLQELSTRIREIVVVDNGSADRTAELARSAGATVLHEARRGYGAACLRALAYISASTSPEIQREAVVAFIDADHSDYPEDLESLIAPIREHRADFTMGSRLVYPEARSAVPLPSRIGNAIASTTMRVLYGVRFTDLGPFRAISFAALGQLEMRDRTWGWTVEMQLRACRAGLVIREIPVRYRARHAGRSKISGSLWGGVRAGVRILWVLGRHVLIASASQRRLRWQRS